jgi:hypothetical protein
MKALVYHGPGQRGWDTVADPTIIVLEGDESHHRSDVLVGAASAG